LRLKRLLLPSPWRGEVEAGAPAKASGEGSLHASGLGGRGPSPAAHLTMRVDLSLRGEVKCA
jgi:hypothetical protein